MTRLLVAIAALALLSQFGGLSGQRTRKQGESGNGNKESGHLKAIVPGDFRYGLRITVAAIGVRVEALKTAAKQAVRGGSETQGRANAVGRPDEPVGIKIRSKRRILGERLGGEENLRSG